MADPSNPRVVIIGGGFGGLNAAYALAGKPVRVTVVDKRNHHLFQPLLYQVATASLSPGDITQPIRHVLGPYPNVKVILAEAESVDTGNRRVILRGAAAAAYDYLIVATGVRHAYFGHEDWRPWAPGLKTLEDALEIRKRILLAFEMAEREEDPALRQAYLSFVIVGGGPTGVELAGALCEIARHALRKEFKEIDPSQAKIFLIERAPAILPIFHTSLSRAATLHLRGLGVEIHVDTAVTRVADGIVEAGAMKIRAKTVLWAAGVEASPLARSLGVPVDKAGRVLVGPDLSVAGRPEVFVIGDLANLAGPGGIPLPGMAPVAIQMGRHAAVNILRRVGDRDAMPFRFRPKGMMAAIGRNAAIAEIGGLRMTGFPAWILWLVAHILFLIGFRNKFIVFTEWAWAYLTFGRGVRLITNDPISQRQEPPA